MGNDGGVIANKRYLIATQDPEWKKKQAARAMSEGAAAAALSMCAMSGMSLALPIVCDELGNLFNKEAVIAHVLAASGASEEQPNPEFAHIRSVRRDIVEVKPTFRPEEKESVSSSTSGKKEDDFLFVCPVTGLESNGKHAFVVIRACGCLVSERAVRMLADKSESSACPSCGTVYPEDKSSIGHIVGHEIKVFQTLEEREKSIEKLKVLDNIRKQAKVKKALEKAASNPGAQLSGSKRRLDLDDSEKDGKQARVTKA